jgi:hypothetical protein
LKPCKIQIYDYYRPRGPLGDPWRHGDRCRPVDPAYALLCDSEEHADRVLAAIERVDALQDEVSVLESKLRSAEDRIAAMC